MPHNCTVLLIEDNDTDAEAVSRAFQKNNAPCTLIRAQHGQDALDLLTRTQWNENKPFPSIVLLDIRMPVMDGIEFLRHIRQDDTLKELNIFILNTYNSPEILNEFTALGIEGHLVKPFDFDRFTTAAIVISNVLTRSHAHKTISPQKILLVDDDSIVRMVIGKVLQKAGYIIINAIDGLDAIKQLDDCADALPNLIITDLSMPHMDGWELIEHLHKTHADIPIMLLSGECGERTKSRAHAIGVDFVFSKDMGASMIRVQAKRLLNRSKK